MTEATLLFVAAFLAVVDAALAVSVVVVFGTSRQPSLAAAGADVRSPSAPIGLLPIAVAAVVVALFGAAQLIVLVLAGGNIFAMIHVVYDALVIGVPLAAIGVLCLAFAPAGLRPTAGLCASGRPAAASAGQAGSRPRETRRPRALRLTRPACFLCVMLLSAAGIGVHATFIEPYRLQIETATVPISPDRAGRAPIRVAVVADIQTNQVGDYERDAIDRVMALKPDLILMPGDLFHGRRDMWLDQIDELRDLVGRLRAPGGVYFVTGNVDHPDLLRRVFEGTDVRLLMNEIVTIHVADRTILLGGVELDLRQMEVHRVVAELDGASETLDSGERYVSGRRGERLPDGADFSSEAHAKRAASERSGGAAQLAGGDASRIGGKTEEPVLDLALSPERWNLPSDAAATNGHGLPAQSPDSPTDAPSSPDVPDGAIRILMSHLPDSMFLLSSQTRVDLVVAGHTHGGQVVLPLFGPRITFSQVPRHVAAGGLHDVNGRRIYVSRGVGVERGYAPRIRFLCPPEITLLTLE